MMSFTNDETILPKLRVDISKMRDITEKAEHAVTKTIAQGADAVTPDSINVTEAVQNIVSTTTAPEPIWWNYGAFIQQCVDFAILAFCVFLMVKLMNRLMKKKAEAPAPVAEPVPTKEEVLLGEIRDLLKAQQQK